MDLMKRAIQPMNHMESVLDPKTRRDMHDSIRNEVSESLEYFIGFIY